jgi:hypothetical protein
VTASRLVRGPPEPGHENGFAGASDVPDKWYEAIWISPSR